MNVLEGVEERVVNKDLANYCELFVMKTSTEDSKKQQDSDKARNAFLALFNDD